MVWSMQPPFLNGDCETRSTTKGCEGLMASGLRYLLWPDVLELASPSDHGGAIVMNSFYKDGHDILALIPSLNKSHIELVYGLSDVFPFKAKAVDAMILTKDYSVEHTWRLGKVWWNVEIESDCEVHEVNGVVTFNDHPF
eukprot:11631267-Ditylum_brightwellii.AAC.1